MSGGRLQGKVAVVTGASSGIGRAIVERYVAEGAKKVVAFARNSAALKAIETAHGDAVLPFPRDVTRSEDLNQLVESLHALRRDAPFGLVHIKLAPACAAQFACSDERERE